ncbi:protein DMP2-like [Olea europaea var. sylvestris]|uniref:protein DMP2-like n=1 Tax=Olea europaea var. sylvestris TaxID=158386 RepID=UPI000C1D0B03|nr:protein DMP2-like [Olea europaea var. sylvestris]
MSTSSSTASSNQSRVTKTYTAAGNFVRLLPTGTVFIYQFLNPLLTNNGKCHIVNKYLSSILISLCGLSCILTTFTDSYTDSQGKTHYGIVTRKGMWVPTDNAGSQDLSSYRLQLGDFIHALFAIFVFAVVVLLDPNSMDCFFPASFRSTQKTLLTVLPVAIGAVSGSVFVAFPCDRHGLGYPNKSPASSSTPASSAQS